MSRRTQDAPFGRNRRSASRGSVRVAPTLPRIVGWAVAALATVALVAGCSDAGEGRSGAGSGDRRSTTSAPGADSTTSAEPGGDERAGRPSEGCGTGPAVTATDDPVADVALTFDSEGLTRTYRLGIPKDYDPEVPAPLVLNLHGAGSNAVQQSAYTLIPAKGTARGHIVVTPDAVAGMWELAGEGRDDRFLMALLDHVMAGWCVDLDRVHATGISLGAWKATITACTHRDRFASIALVAEEVAPDGCGIPVVAFHGTADYVVPYGEGADEGVVVTGPNKDLPGVEVNMPKWARNNGCSEERDVERIGDDVERWIYRGCPDGTGVELYSILHGGHTWPGAAIDRPPQVTTRTIDATDLALDWFEAHPLR